MAVDKVEPPKVAVLPLSKGVIHHGETPQHLNYLVHFIIPFKILVFYLTQAAIIIKTFNIGSVFHFYFHNFPPPQSSRTQPPSGGGGW